MSDLIIPIVFPEYRVSIITPKAQIDVFPWVDFDNFTIPSTNQKLSNLGHAGVLFINGKTGTTKYFEYGRYDPPNNLGIVVKAANLPDIKLASGKIEVNSLIKPLDFISRISGQSGRVHGVFIEVEGKYQAMLDYALLRKSQNANPKRKPYDLTSNSCIHFVKQVTEKAGVKTPWMIDPRPNSYIGEFRDDYNDLDYSPKNKILKIEGMGEFK